jgi:glyoxylase-like metal-dependent hydrolase (beta-lactamase superfamily II)
MPPFNPMALNALPNDLRVILPDEPLPEPHDCCGPLTAPASRLQLPGRTLSRRSLIACASVPGLVFANRAKAETYPPLPEDLIVQRVEGTQIYYVLGHAGVPNAQNAGHTSNAGFVITDEGVVVFDALGTPSLGWALLQKIRALTDKPIKYVVLSHYHADHIYGLQAFRDHTDAIIVAQMEGLNYTAAGNLNDEAAAPRLAQRRVALAPWVNQDTRIVLPEVVFQIAAEITLGRQQLQLIYAGPAHSMSDLMMFVLSERVLFAGDIVQNGRIPFMASAAVDTRNWLKGLGKVATLGPRFIIPGHGKPSTNAADAVVFTRDYIDFLRQIMGEAVRQWTEFDTAYQAADWSRYRSLPAFEASNRGNAYRVFLDLEQEALANPPAKGDSSP